MASEKTYNGWTNYETWNVKLWMDNEEGSYHYYKQLAQECYDSAMADDMFSREENAIGDLRERMKDEYENAMADLLEQTNKTASVWADLLGAALSEVNWHEIASHLMEETDKEEE